jgi:transposase
MLKVKEIIYMSKQYSAELNLEAVRRYENSGKGLTTTVAEELDIKPTIMQRWVNKYKKSPYTPFKTVAI